MTTAAATAMARCGKRTCRRSSIRSSRSSRSRAAPSASRVLASLARVADSSASVVASASQAWTVAPSWEWMGHRRAYAFDPELGAMGLRVFPSESLVHLAVTRRGLLRGLDAVLSVHNAFNQTVFLPQPDDGGHPPLLGPGREWNLRLTYALKP